MRRTILYILLLALTACLVCPLSTHDIPQTAADGLLRLHVVANSDSPEDQVLKLRIKDRIISEIGSQVSSIDNKKGLLDYLDDNIDRIEKIAGQEIQKTQKEYRAKAEVGSFRFPTRSYGSLTLPAGEYHALRIVLGEGKGANWWCVMFPPLCFVDTKNGVAYARDQKRVEEMLAGEDRAPVEMDNMENMPVRARFRVLELINESRVKLVETFR